MHAWRGTAALGALGWAVASCAQLLEVDSEFQSAVETICKCEALSGAAGVFPDVDSSASCASLLSASFAGSREQEQAWLARFAENSCQQCDNIAACVSVEPVCIAPGEPCNPAAERADIACCGHDPAIPLQGYCSATNGMCASNSAGCLPTFAPCTENLECCGGDAGTSSCEPLNDQPDSEKFCFRLCDLEDPVQCEGCCARVKPKTADPEFGVCLDFEGAIVDCSDLCLDGGDCSELAICDATDQGDFFIYECQPLF